MREASNARWKPSMSVCSRLPKRSWHSSAAIASPRARHSPASLPLWIKLLSRLCAPCFSKTSWPDRWRGRSKRADCGIGAELAPWCAILMARDKLPANALYPAHLIYPPQRVGCRRCVLLAIPGASGVKWSGRARPFSKLTPGSRLGTFCGSSGAGNGENLGELRQAVKAISASVKAQAVPLSQAVMRLDGQYPRDAQRETSKRAEKERDVPLTYHRDEGKREKRRKEKRREENHRSCMAKNMIHRKRGCENEQMDPLDGRTQVEDTLRRERAVSSSDPQTQG